MAMVKAVPCDLGTTKYKNNPPNREVATAIALHDLSQQAFKLALVSPDGFESTLRQMEIQIKFYRAMTSPPEKI